MQIFFCEKNKRKKVSICWSPIFYSLSKGAFLSGFTTSLNRTYCHDSILCWSCLLRLIGFDCFVCVLSVCMRLRQNETIHTVSRRMWIWIEEREQSERTVCVQTSCIDSTAVNVEMWWECVAWRSIRFEIHDELCSQSLFFYSEYLRDFATFLLVFFLLPI